MYVVRVDVFVTPEKVDSFIDETLQNATGAKQEPGNLRFDVSQSNDDPCRFLLYEVYHDEAAFRVHQQTEHYKKWKETVADWMAQPRNGVKFSSLCSRDNLALSV